MKGIVSFHPIDPSFFEGTIEPLVAGEKINPEDFLAASLRHLVASWESARYKQTLDFLLEQIEPPPPPEDGTMWDKVRTRLERFDHRPSELVRMVATHIDPELHLGGRPFLITEGSAESVAGAVDAFTTVDNESRAERLIIEQLAALDPKLPDQLELDDAEPSPPPGSYRNELLQELRVIFDQSRLARDDQAWGPAGSRREPARDVLVRELPWRAVQLHAKAVPFWYGEDVDGLETICLAAGLEPPNVLVPAWGLFQRSCDAFPELRDRLGVELQDERSVGAYVPPHDIPALLDYLNDFGARIIQVATRHGVGATCKTLLRKIRECACYAQRTGGGYLEASGVQPVGPELPENEEVA